jgi:hypothetical protein
MKNEAPPARAWQRMLSGRRLDLLDPSPADVEIADIAHGLARVARWNGQTKGEHAFSVAQHVVFVEAITQHLETGWSAEWRLAALLHDAPEYVIGDLISPFKTAIGLDYKAFEMKLLAAIHERFGLPAVLPNEVTRTIKEADRIAAYIEATALAGFSESEGRLYFGDTAALDSSVVTKMKGIEAWPVHSAQDAFLVRFRQLAKTG